jgi:hypothetical protein
MEMVDRPTRENEVPMNFTEVVGRRPILGKRPFLERKARSGKKTAGRKRNTCEGSMQGAHARET